MMTQTDKSAGFTNTTKKSLQLLPGAKRWIPNFLFLWVDSQSVTVKSTGNHHLPTASQSTITRNLHETGSVWSSQLPQHCHTRATGGGLIVHVVMSVGEQPVTEWEHTCRATL